MYGDDTNRIVIERELIALIFRKNELVEYLQIKPNYLFDKTNVKILESMIKCYQKNKIIDTGYIMDEDLSFPLDTYLDIITNDMFYLNDWQRQFKLSQELILKHYKTDFVQELNKKLENKTIKYEDFEKKMEQISQVTIE